MVAKVLALIIFLVMFLLIVTEKIERQYVTLGCGAITLIVNLHFVTRLPLYPPKALDLNAQKLTLCYNVRWQF